MTRYGGVTSVSVHERVQVCEDQGIRARYVAGTLRHIAV